MSNSLSKIYITTTYDIGDCYDCGGYEIYTCDVNIDGDKYHFHYNTHFGGDEWNGDIVQIFLFILAKLSINFKYVMDTLGIKQDDVEYLPYQSLVKDDQSLINLEIHVEVENDDLDIKSISCILPNSTITINATDYNCFFLEVLNQYSDIFISNADLS